MRHRRWVSSAVFALLCSAVEPAFAQDLPKLSVADETADETVDQTDATLDFVVSLSASASGEVTVDYATSDGTAVAVDDYEAASGTRTFAAGTVEQTISVSLVDDSLDELQETLDLTLSDPVGATIDDGVATGTIKDDDPEPELTARGVAAYTYDALWVFEGEDVTVAVRLSDPSGRTITVDYATMPETSWGTNAAEAGSDYTHMAATLTFDPGERSKTIAVKTNNDNVFEGFEEFRIGFSNPQGATLYQRSGLVIIGSPAMYLDIFMWDDESAPSVTLGDAADVESAGELAFSVTLTGPIEASMTYSTADGTAVGGEDYTAATDATLSFGPGVISNTIRIAVDDDDVVEAATETFSVRLSQTYSPLISSVGDLEATGTIQDDDGAARLFIGDASASEGDGTLSFTVILGGQSGSSVTVDYATAGATATAGEDYTETSGTLTFASGDIRKTIPVPLRENDRYEASETFSMSLSGAVGATLDDGTGTGTIHDDDESPLMTIHGSEGPESGLLDFVVTLSTASGAAASVDYLTDQDFLAYDPPAFSLADAGSDFEYQEGALTFAPGETSKTIRVVVLEDLVDEPNEAVIVTLEHPVNARFQFRYGSDTCPWSGCVNACCDCGTILDDDEAELSIVDASGPENASHLEFEVSLGAQTGNSVTVSYDTSDATAIAGEDYEAASGTLTFQAGTVLRTIPVLPVDDDRAEPTETFVVKLSSPVGATLADAEGIGTITDNDDPPEVSIGDAEGTEGESAAFEVILGEASGREVTVAFGTSDGTAAGGEDYETVAGILTFAPGDLARAVPVELKLDGKDEPDETFTVDLSSASNATLGTAVGTGTIEDADDPPALSVGAASGVEGSTAGFAVVLDAASDFEIEVDYATSDGTAVAGEDYEAASGTLTFAPGEKARTVPVSLSDDVEDEPAETFSLALSMPVDATVAVGVATGTIIDNDDPPEVSIGDAEGAEGESAAFEVILGEASGREVTVAFGTSDGTAAGGEDYETVAGILTFAPGDLARAVPVELKLDGKDEPDETFTVELSSASNATLGTAVGTGTIEDADDPPALSVGAASGVEGSKPGFAVILDAASDFEIEVDYATSDGTAVAGEDYEAASGTLTFAPGEKARTVPVSLSDDVEDEPAETFSLALSMPVDATVAVGVATGTIIDNDDPPEVSIGDAEGPEGESAAFEVILGEASGREVTVAFGTSDGTAAGGEDYETVAGILTFAPGDLARAVPVELKLDGKDEPDETFTVELSSASNATLGTAVGTGTIEDADDPPALSVGAASGVEGSTAGFAVILDAASDFEIEVDYATSDGTAVAGEDYEAASGTLTFAPGEKARTVPVSLSDDVEDEPAETFSLALSMPVDATVAVGVATGTIVDNDDPPAFSVAGGAGAEGDAVEFSVTLAGSSSRSATVSYATSDGTAVAVDDYVAASGTLTFAPGESDRTLTVRLKDDDRDEPTETFAMTLSSPTNATMDTATADGTVIDNDGAPQLSIAGAAGGEGDVVDFVVTLAGSTEQTVTVSYATKDGTAVADEDYPASEGVLTFAPGESSRTVSVMLGDDAVHEPTETFTVTLSSPENADIAVASAVGRIADDDRLPTLSVVSGAGREGAVAEFVVTLAGSGSEPATVGYATTDGTAVAGADYLATEGALTFAPGGAAMTVPVTLLVDGVDEPDETFVLQLRSPTNATLAVGDAAGTIEDIDELPTLSVTGGEGVEGGTAEFAVTLVGSTSRPVSAAYATSDGSALSGIDYGPVRGVLTFAPGESRRTVPVALVDDSTGEPDETFTLALSSVRNAVVAVSSATGTIIDDDDETALSIAGGTDIEGGAVGFVVTLAGSGDRAVTVSYATSDRTAVADDDYEAASGTLTFAPGESSRTVSVSLVDDDRDEPTENFAMTLSSAANATIHTATANGTILDNDGAPRLSIGGAAGGEGDVLAFVVTLAGSSGQSVTVSYATGDGTAVAGEDYEATEGVLTFAPGDPARTVSVSLLDDAVYEREENFALELSSPANATLGTSTATGTIIDDDRAGKAPTKGRVLLFEPSADPDRQGFVRIINHSAEAGEILVEAVDDSGMRVGPVTLAIGAGEATHFNSDDLEAGNARKGLPDGVGPPSAGIWRLELSSLLDIEVLSYARTSDGFVTSLHDTAPASAGVHRVVFLNPGGNVDQVSRLRLINPGTEDAFVTIAGTDDMGGMSAEVVVDIPAGTAREWTAAELESGTGTDGALGQGDGKWRLRISSGSPVVAMSLIESPTGNLTNLSTLPRTPGGAEGTYMVPLFPSASDTTGRQGFIRVVNHSGEAAEVRIEAFDNTVWEYGPLALAVGADEVASFNSDDLELGNEAKGLTGSTGAGEGDWWLELSGDADIGVLSYIRTTDGFLTSMHDLVPEENGVHRVVFFNPAKNFNQVSVLWLVNTDDADAEAAITGVDDEGAMPGTAVRVAVPAGSSRKLTSAELESGEADAIDSGALGDGDGKWRLRVASDRPILVVSLLENPTGHLTNLSTAPGRSANPEQASALPSAEHLE